MTVLFVLFLIIADIIILIKGCRITDDEEKDHKKGMIILLAAVFVLTILIGVLLALFAEAAARTAFSSCNICITRLGAMGRIPCYHLI